MNAANAPATLLTTVTRSVQETLIELAPKNEAEFRKALRAAMGSVARLLHKRFGASVKDASELAVGIVVNAANELGHDITAPGLTELIGAEI